MNIQNAYVKIARYYGFITLTNIETTFCIQLFTNTSQWIITAHWDLCFCFKLLTLYTLNTFIAT